MESREQIAEKYLQCYDKNSRGKLKIYIGMSAGVGKTFRMLQEAQTLLRNGVNVKIGFIETHDRAETIAQLKDLPLIPRKEVFYKGKRLEEMDLSAILILQPQVIIVDELAHTNIPGSKNEKRWQDILDILNAGIDVISAVNIQHIESINEEVKRITGISVQERVPDSLLKEADEVVNIDLTADELITRLKEGKIYKSDKVEQALKNFFQPEKILQLRELALREVATQVERKIEDEIPKEIALPSERFLACISSNEITAARVIRKTARLASYYNAKWYVLYVQTPKESTDKIALNKQRFLINNFKLATELDTAEVIKICGTNIAEKIIEVADNKQITTVCIGKPHLNLFQIIIKTNVFNQLLNKLSKSEIDLVILS
ncbi:MAG: universal stress protein [Spirosomataceae bacterium]